jgi:hypothetical protein
MAPSVEQAAQALRSRQDELRRLGVRHAAVFGSTARGKPAPKVTSTSWSRSTTTAPSASSNTPA